MSTPYLLTADAIAPMDPALPSILLNAGLVITDDRITAIDELPALRSQFGNIPITHHPGLLFPGLINPHTHLELSYLSAENLKAPHFTQWVAALMANRPPLDQLETVVRAAFRKGLSESLAAGITTLGDISRNSAITRDEYVAHSATTAAPRIVSFGEVVALGKMRHRITELLDAATTPFPTQSSVLSPQHSVGISPHAPYTVEGPALRAAVRRAIIKQLPLAMHLAELSEEAPFLRDLSGPLGRDWDLMQKMDIIDDAIPQFRGGPIRWAQLHGLLTTDPSDLTVLLAHVNYCDNAELDMLAATTASVAYCPRTRHYFGHDAITSHRYRDMLDAGINVCLATDSLASNPDLNLLKEAQLLHERDALDPLAALEMITRRGALALGLSDDVGSLSPNKFADFTIFPTDIALASEPTALLSALLTTAPAPTAVYIAGKKIS